MVGKDELSNAILGGSSDYMTDIGTHLVKTFFAQGDEKVFNLNSSWFLMLYLTIIRMFIDKVGSRV